MAVSGGSPGSQIQRFSSDPCLNSIPVVMLTSFSSRRQDTGIPVNRDYMLETEDYIEKPVSPKELLARVGACLAKKK
jgi:DNA-binding response OmpR family regulator